MEKRTVHVPPREYKGTKVFDACEIDAIQEMEVRADDIWVISYPRSGTTLVQEIVYLIQTKLDFVGAKQPMDERFPFLDQYQPALPLFRGIRGVAEMTSPRRIKSHLHYHVLPQKLFKSNCKKLYIMRNPKDTFVSILMLHRFLKQFDPDFPDQQFFEEWINDEAYASPWWQHVRDFWTHQSDDLLVLQYEHVVKDMRSAVRRIANHLEVQLNDKEIELIVEHCQFSNMKANPSVQGAWVETYRCVDKRFGGHVRSGKIGDWRNHVTPEMSDKIDQMVEDKLGDLQDLKFDYGDDI